MAEIEEKTYVSGSEDKQFGYREKSRSARIMVAIAGISIGAVGLWLVMRSVDIGDLKSALFETQPVPLALAMAAFWISIYVRIARWHQLLILVAPIRRRHVAESAIVGYAASIVMPARLGEPFRAEYTQRRFHLDRYAVFGSIITERLIDAIAVIAILFTGLVLAAQSSLITDYSRLSSIVSGALGIIFATAAILIILRFRNSTGISLPEWLDGPIRRLLYGVASLNFRNLIAVTACTLLIWALEIGALWAIFLSLGTSLTIVQLFILTGVATLSTLLPAAPGYVGSLQFVFGFGMASMKMSAVTGVLAATLVQLIFYGSLIVVATIAAIFLRGSRLAGYKQ